MFPTIPTFTYNERVEISLPDDHTTGLKALNYRCVNFHNVYVKLQNQLIALFSCDLLGNALMLFIMND